MQSCPTTDRIVLVKQELNYFHPLNEFYDQSVLPLRAVVRVEDRDVPEPHKSLLAEIYSHVTADAAINGALNLTGSSLLCDHRNIQWNASRQPLAQVVESLPPSTS